MPLTRPSSFFVVAVLVVVLTASAQDEMTSARERVRAISARHVNSFFRGVRDGSCGTGVYAPTSRAIADELLSLEPLYRAAWLDLSLEEDGSWERHALGAAVASDPRCMLGAAKERADRLLETLRIREAAEHQLDRTLATLLVGLHHRPAIPYFIEAMRREAPTSRNDARHFARLATMRSPRTSSPPSTTIERMAEVDDYERWWMRHETLLPIESLLETIAAREVTSGEPTLTYVRELLSAAGAMTKSHERACAAILDSSWPRPAIFGREPDLILSDEWFGFMRDAVFLAFWRIAPERAIALMDAGLRRNDAVEGDFHESGDAMLTKRRYLRDFDLVSVIRDVDGHLDRSGPKGALLAKWLVIRDQFGGETEHRIYAFGAKPDHLHGEKWVLAVKAPPAKAVYIDGIGPVTQVSRHGNGLETLTLSDRALAVRLERHR